MPARRIAVIGPGGADLDPALEATAAAAGDGLAAAGATVVCGGLGGVMAAAARGAANRGGAVIGFLPGDDPAAANRWITEAIPTGAARLGSCVRPLTGQAGGPVGLSCSCSGW